MIHAAPKAPQTVSLTTAHLQSCLLACLPLAFLQGYPPFTMSNRDGSWKRYSLLELLRGSAFGPEALRDDFVVRRWWQLPLLTARLTAHP